MSDNPSGWGKLRARLAGIVFGIFIGLLAIAVLEKYEKRSEITADSMHLARDWQTQAWMCSTDGILWWPARISKDGFIGCMIEDKSKYPVTRPNSFEPYVPESRSENITENLPRGGPMVQGPGTAWPPPVWNNALISGQAEIVYENSEGKVVLTIYSDGTEALLTAKTDPVFF